MSAKKEQVKSKVKKLLLGKKELLLDKDDIEEQYSADDNVFTKGHFVKVSWGRGQTKNKKPGYENFDIFIHKNLLKKYNALQQNGDVKRDWNVYVGTKAASDTTGDDYNRDGWSIMLQSTGNADALKNLVQHAVASGWAGIEVLAAGNDIVVVLDGKPNRTQNNQLFLKLTSGPSRLHPIKLLQGAQVYRNSHIVFDQRDVEEAKQRTGRGGGSNYEAYPFSLINRSQGLTNFIEANGRLPFRDEVGKMSRSTAASRSATSVSNQQASVHAEAPTTILFSAPEVKKVEQSVEDAAREAFLKAGGSAPAPAPASVEAQPVLATDGDRIDRLSSREEVMALQTSLNQLGFTVRVDGKWGPETEGMVRAFQAQNRLAIDGVVGPDTIAAMENALNAPQAAASTPGNSTAYSGNVGGNTATPAAAPTVEGGWMSGLVNGAWKHLSGKGGLGTAVPLSVLLAIGVGGAFAWRKFVKGRENRKMAAMLARDRRLQMEMEALLRQSNVPVDYLRTDRDFQRSVMDMERAEYSRGRELGGEKLDRGYTREIYY